MWPMIVGAVIGAVNKMGEQQQADRDRVAAAETARWSPWTGLKPQQVRDPGSVFSGAAQGALAGAAFGQQFNKGGAASGAEGSSNVAGGEAAESVGSRYNLGVDGGDPQMAAVSERGDDLWGSGARKPRYGLGVKHGG